MAFAQKRNDVQLTYNHVSKLETNGKPLSKEAQTDLLLAAITLKYTQVQIAYISLLILRYSPIPWVMQKMVK